MKKIIKYVSIDKKNAKRPSCRTTNYVKWQNRTKINGEMGHLPLYKGIVLLK